MQCKKLTKRDIRNRVTQNGKTLTFDKFEWDSKTRTFDSSCSNLIIDFVNLDSVVVNVGNSSIINVGNNSIVNVCDFCVINGRDSVTVHGYDNNTINTGNNSLIKSNSMSMISTLDRSHIDAGDLSIVRTTDRSIIYAGNNTVIECGSNTTIRAGVNCACVRKDMIEYFRLKAAEIIKTNRFGEKGFIVLKKEKKILINGKYMSIDSKSFRKIEQYLENEKVHAI